MFCTDRDFEFRSLPPRLDSVPRLMIPVCVAVDGFMPFHKCIREKFTTTLTGIWTLLADPIFCASNRYATHPHIYTPWCYFHWPYDKGDGTVVKGEVKSQKLSFYLSLPMMWSHKYQFVPFFFGRTPAHILAWLFRLL